MRSALAVLALALPVGALDVSRSVPVVLPQVGALAPLNGASSLLPLPELSALSPLSPLSPAVGLEAAAAQDLVPLQTALEAGRRIIEAVQPGSPVSVEARSNAVFDGLNFAKPGASAVPVNPNGVSGAALFSELHEKSGRGYREHDYESSSDYMFKTADRRVVDGKSGVMDAYSGIFVAGGSQNGGDYPENGDSNRDGEVDKGMNVEHIWPQSYFAKRLPMRSDLHHLMATFIHPNGIRSNLPFGVVKGKGEYSNSAGAKMGQGVFEPPDFSKGRVARAMLYFYVRYHDKNITNGAFNEKFWNGSVEMFLDWNRRFPPDDWERARNGLVEKWQGNRNPFVDDHTLADQIGADALKRRTRTAAQHMQQAVERRDRRDKRTNRRRR